MAVISGFLLEPLHLQPQGGSAAEARRAPQSSASRVCSPPLCVIARQSKVVWGKITFFLSPAQIKGSVEVSVVCVIKGSGRMEKRSWGGGVCRVLLCARLVLNNLTLVDNVSLCRVFRVCLLRVTLLPWVVLFTHPRDSV